MSISRSNGQTGWTGAGAHDAAAPAASGGGLTVGRTAELDVDAALAISETVRRARGCLAEGEQRGSTAEERDAARDWLAATLREQHVRKPPIRNVVR
jgi:hypothetical protein